MLSCAHAGIPATGSAAGSYTFQLYRAPCTAYVGCLDPPNPRSVLVLLDEPIVEPASPGACSARDGFTYRGCWILDPQSDAPFQPAAWRRLETGEIEVGLGCGEEQPRLILDGNSGKLIDAPWAAPAKEWPVEVRTKPDDGKLRCASNLIGRAP